MVQKQLTLNPPSPEQRQRKSKLHFTATLQDEDLSCAQAGHQLPACYCSRHVSTRLTLGKYSCSPGTGIKAPFVRCPLSPCQHSHTFALGRWR